LALCSLSYVVTRSVTANSLPNNIFNLTFLNYWYFLLKYVNVHGIIDSKYDRILNKDSHSLYLQIAIREKKTRVCCLDLNRKTKITKYQVVYACYVQYFVLIRISITDLKSPYRLFSSNLITWIFKNNKRFIKRIANCNTVYVLLQSLQQNVLTDSLTFVYQTNIMALLFYMSDVKLVTW
jgi:hypothetical protein